MMTTSWPFMTSPGSTSWVEALQNGPNVVRMQVRGDGLAHRRPAVFADDLLSGGVPVDDPSVLVHHNAIGRVLDQKLEALAQCRSDWSVPGMCDVLDDSDHPARTGLGNGKRTHEDTMVGAVRSLDLLKKVISVPEDAGLCSGHERLQKRGPEFARLDGHPRLGANLLRLVRPPYLELTAGWQITEDTFERHVPLNAEPGDLQLPRHHIIRSAKRVEAWTRVL